MSMNNSQNQHWSPLFSMQQEDGPSSHCLADQTDEYDSVKWTTSTMNLMKRMQGPDKITVTKHRKNHHMEDQDLQNRGSSYNSANEITRVCTNCNTTKTPLWRGGPFGPKSLCNACGIRQMKARRAMRLAADVDRTVPFKKRFKISSASSPSPFQF